MYLFALALSAALQNPSGPAILIIQRSNGRDFVPFSSYARCVAPKRFLEAQAEEARRKNEANGFQIIPGTEPIHTCIPG